MAKRVYYTKLFTTDTSTEWNPSAKKLKAMCYGDKQPTLYTKSLTSTMEAQNTTKQWLISGIKSRRRNGIVRHSVEFLPYYSQIRFHIRWQACNLFNWARSQYTNTGCTIGGSILHTYDEALANEKYRQGALRVFISGLKQPLCDALFCDPPPDISTALALS